MDSKRRFLQKSKLYLILDTQVCDYRRLFEIIGLGIKNGIDIFQLRDKNGDARDIINFSKRAMTKIRGRALYILNDRVDLTLYGNVDGVHLGQNDLDVSFARKLMGAKKIIGVSCQTIKHIKEAQRKKIDYIGFGSIFKTLTKPTRSPMNLSLLKKAGREVKVPLFAIGGINKNNVDVVTECGINRIAVCRALLQSKNLRNDIKELNSKL